MIHKLVLNQVQIESNRLILKPIDHSFTDEIFRYFTSDITLYMRPQPSDDLQAITEFIDSSLKGLKDGNNLQLVIFEKKSEDFLGCAGLHKIGREDPELGIWIKKQAHGKGYGLEAISALIDRARNNLSFTYLRYPVDKRNVASRRIPEQNGGVIKKEFKEINQRGFELDEVEYWIYK